MVKKVGRNWLCYSPTIGNVYCFMCKLMSKQTKDPGIFSNVGFRDWKHADRAIPRHEGSKYHRDSILAVMTLGTVSGHKLSKRVNTSDSIAATSWPGLNDEIFGSHTNGNFLGILELLSKFDPFLAQHIERYGAKGRGNSSYLSSTICDEFIKTMGEHVLKHIVNELKSAKYFSVTVDSSHDISHVDQLTCFLRYVLPDGPVERFVSFLNMRNHSGQELARNLLDFLKVKNVDIANCRGQSYDNASNMSGKYNGVQAKIREINPLALFITCCAHSLNLVGQCAVDCCQTVVAFFEFVQSLYVFFSASTHRWFLLESKLKPHNMLVVKRLSDTRWSAHSDALSALVKGYSTISSLLEKDQ